jgi:hypothetical protein
MLHHDARAPRTSLADGLAVPRAIRLRDIPAARHPRKIRFTAAEWATIVERAQLSGRRPARYVREAALGTVPKVVRKEVKSAVVHELARIGTALTQLAATLRDQGAEPRAAALDEAVAELLAVVRGLE